MTKDKLCALALAAIDDADARVVLVDAIEESGWSDSRAVNWFVPDVGGTPSNA